MMNLIQDTVAGFSRSASRRMDAELCVVNMCQPELDSDMDALLARLTKIEDQIQTGSFQVTQYTPVITEEVPQIKEEPIVLKKPEIPEVKEEKPVEATQDQAPVGFWTDVAAAVRKELNPSLMGFFATTPNAPLRGIVCGDRLILSCANKFIQEIVNKPDILELVTRKASAKLGRPLRVVVTDQAAAEEKNEQLEQLLDFGRAHSDIVTIKDN